MQKQGREIIIALGRAGSFSLKAPPLKPATQLGRVQGYKLKKRGRQALLILRMARPSSIKCIFKARGKASSFYSLVIDMHYSSPHLPIRPSLEQQGEVKPHDAEAFIPTSIDALTSHLLAEGADTPYSSALDPSISAPPTPLGKSLKLPQSLDLPLPYLPSLSDKPVVLIEIAYKPSSTEIFTLEDMPKDENPVQIALSLERQLNESGEYTAVLTHKGPQGRSTQESLAQAKQVGADILLCLHVDAQPSLKVCDLSVYALSHRDGKEEVPMLEAKRLYALLMKRFPAEHRPLINVKLIPSPYAESSKE